MLTISIPRLLLATLAAALLLQAPAASALGLLQAYEAALQNDPVYRSAAYDNESSQQAIAIGRSSLLPTASLNYSLSSNRADRTLPGQLGLPVTDHPQYTSKAGTVQLRQPIFSPEGIARYRQGVAQAGYSEAVFSGHMKELIVRLVSAYADTQYAEDQLNLATAQRDAFAEQKRVNERMFLKGEGTKTDMLETQSKFDLAEAQVLEARDNLSTARSTLATIVGIEVTQLDSLSNDFQIESMQPASFEEWKALALENNTDIAAQRYAVESTRQDVNKNRAGHLPRLDMVASYSKNQSDSLNTYNQDTTNRSVGVQLTIPILSGGYVSAVTSQAVSNHERAKVDLEDKTNKALVELHKQYSLVLSSTARIDALVKSADSSRLLVSATQQSVKGGMRINLDVLNAQQQLYTVLRDLAQARYNYLLGYLRLRFAAGTLKAEDLQKVAGYFTPAQPQ